MPTLQCSVKMCAALLKTQQIAVTWLPVMCHWLLGPSQARPHLLQHHVPLHILLKAGLGIHAHRAAAVHQQHPWQRARHQDHGCWARLAAPLCPRWRRLRLLSLLLSPFLLLLLLLRLLHLLLYRRCCQCSCQLFGVLRREVDTAEGVVGRQGHHRRHHGRASGRAIVAVAAADRLRN